MTIGSLASSKQKTAMEAGFFTNEVRTLIANHLGVKVERVTDEAHFTDDLGADWLDCLELMIVIEDQFAEVEITDDDLDQIGVVGDLIRHIESMRNERRRCPIVEAPLQWFASPSPSANSCRIHLRHRAGLKFHKFR
jgi:acyl carrier protein